MGCGESKNAVATANTISQRKKINEEDTIIDKEGEKESHNGQDLVAEKSENSKPREEGGHDDEEKAAKKEGDDEIVGDGEEKKKSQASPDQSLSSTDGIHGAVSEGLSGKSDVSGSKISKVEDESAVKKQVQEAESNNENGSEGENNKEEEASSDIQSKASSPDDEQKESLRGS